MPPLARMLILLGLLMAAAGVALWAFPILGRLPGDIRLQRGNFTFYFPLTTSIIISVVLSIVIAIMRR